MMVPKDFEVGNLVWAKMKGFPPWPAKIVDPPAESRPPKQKRAHHYVYFFGSKNHAWILDENIVPHTESMLQFANTKKSAPFQGAVEAIINYIKSGSGLVEEKPSGSKTEDIFDTDVGKDVKAVQIIKYVPKKREGKIVKKFPSKKVKIEKVHKKLLKKHPMHVKRPIAVTKTSAVSTEPQSVREDDFSALFSSVSTSMSYSSLPMTDEGHSSGQSSGVSARSSYKEPSPEPLIDLKTVSDTLKTKHVTPTPKKIGFIGLGLMGRGIVKNLLQSGHHVSVWNRTLEKCDIFAGAGALKCQTPAHVVENSDIIFCCVSDPDAAKSLIFENRGILTGMGEHGQNKGYVEMTSIDPETSQEIAEALTGRGARYLEAPVKGSKRQAEEGTLFILAAGDRTLFTDCETCFHAMGHHAYFLSTEIGCASKMNIIHSMLHGTVFVALAEAMALVERVKLSQTDLFNIISLGTLRCPGLIEKGRAIITRNFTPNTPLKYMQKDMSFALTMGGYYDQPLPVTAAANEVYKHAKYLKYADYDVCAVFQGAKF